jgi:hypothetical protein
VSITIFLSVCLSVATPPLVRASSDDSTITHQPPPSRFTVRLSRDGRFVNWWDTVLNVDIFLDSSDTEVSGFDFRVGYNTASLYNPIVSLSPMLADPDSGFGWQSFGYELSPAGELVSDCASEMLRITANSGARWLQTSGKSLPPVAGGPPVLLARIQFYIKSQEKYYCFQLPDGAVRFLWLDSMDNHLASDQGNTIFVGMNRASRTLYTEDFLAEYPSYHGIPNDSCKEKLRSPIVNGIDFLNGGLSWACADSGGGGADINLNEIGYEESDARLYGEYFLFDTAVFTYNVDIQKAATDLNSDGVPLTLSDLVILKRVICGDMSAWGCQIRTVRRLLQYEKNVLAIDKPVGVALFHVKGKVTPQLLAPDMELLQHFDGVNTRILIWSPPGVCGKTIRGDILKVKGKIVRWEFASYEGYNVHAELLKK